MSHACFLQFVQRQTLHNMMAVVMLRQCTPTDAAQICDIYNYYVREMVVTFEESPVPEADMARRIAEITSQLPWLVWEVDGVILGCAYATPWKVRAAYGHSVESSI